MSDENHERVQDSAIERQHERTQIVEETLADFESRLADHKFPTRPEELAEQYGEGPLDLPNETETLGDVFDRLGQDEEYESVEEVREAVYGELTGEAADEREYNPERELDEIAAQLIEEDPRDEP